MNNEDDAIFLMNLEKERKHLGFTKEEFARILGMTIYNYNKLIAGNVVKIPKYEIARDLYCYTMKNVYDLCGASDTMPYAKFVANLKKLPKHVQDAIMISVDTYAQIIDPESDFARIPKVPCYTPTGNMHDGMFYDSAVKEFIDVSHFQGICPFKIDCAIRVTSNDLIPTYFLDDILLVSRTAPRNNDTGIFIHKKTHRIYIRRFKQTNPCELIPLNEFGDTIFVDSYNKNDMNQWIKFGIVMKRISLGEQEKG